MEGTLEGGTIHLVVFLSARKHKVSNGKWRQTYRLPPPPQLGYKREAAGKANLDGEQL